MYVQNVTTVQLIVVEVLYFSLNYSSPSITVIHIHSAIGSIIG